MGYDATQDAPGTGAGDVPDHGAGGRRRKDVPQRRHRVLRVLGVVGLTLVTVVGLFGVYAYRTIDANFTRGDWEKDMAVPRIANRGPDGAIDILVMGQDTREGENAIDGEAGGGVSDTTILIHLSEDRKRAYGVSIPRDTLVDRPDCKDPETGEIIPGESDQMWNEAFAVGGPGCTLSQFEQLSGIRAEYSVVVDFAGFRDMVDAVGGVPICVPTYIHDPKARITLQPGTREVSGDEALDYVRIRSGYGEDGERVLDGSDTGRIKRQQVFIAALANKIVSAGTLANPIKVLNLLKAVTKSIEMTGADNLKDLAGLGYQFRSIGTDRIKFVTIPWGPAPEDPNRVRLLPEAEDVWQRLLADERLTKEQTEGGTSASRAPGGKGSGKGSGDGKGGGSGSEGSTSEDDRAAELLRYGICA